ncbi:unnamed protein product [Cercopithifilaria johnstoni]|uniref:Uncharacterized protein n=1 Tax=Cercopithifilaria johnstoni TaxID=2874296 RepID=A0A8J2Q611_9BILA|nr:unnamed protein product [Cercopithifilaria johnstoni]
MRSTRNLEVQVRFERKQNDSNQFFVIRKVHFADFYEASTALHNIAVVDSSATYTGVRGALTLMSCKVSHLKYCTAFAYRRYRKKTNFVKMTYKISTMKYKIARYLQYFDESTVAERYQRRQ